MYVFTERHEIAVIPESFCEGIDVRQVTWLKELAQHLHEVICLNEQHLISNWIIIHVVKSTRHHRLVATLPYKILMAGCCGAKNENQTLLGFRRISRVLFPPNTWRRRTSPFSRPCRKCRWTSPCNQICSLCRRTFALQTDQKLA